MLTRRNGWGRRWDLQWCTVCERQPEASVYFKFLKKICLFSRDYGTIISIKSGILAHVWEVVIKQDVYYLYRPLSKKNTHTQVATHTMFHYLCLSCCPNTACTWRIEHKHPLTVHTHTHDHVRGPRRVHVSTSVLTAHTQHIAWHSLGRNTPHN